MRKRVMLVLMVVILISVSMAFYLIKNQNSQNNLSKKLSNTILVGLEYSSLADENTAKSHEIKIYKNKKVEYWLDNKLKSKDMLTDEQYNNIKDGINLESIYNTTCVSKKDAYDGWTTTIILYGIDNLPLKEIGCYMPKNKNINNAYNTIMKNIPDTLFDN